MMMIMMMMMIIIMMFREDGCSVTKCGARATCTDLGGEGSCSCDIGYDDDDSDDDSDMMIMCRFEGNPYSRCYPIEVPR